MPADLHSLPNELLEHVLLRVTSCDLLSFAEAFPANSRLHTVLHRPALWRRVICNVAACRRLAKYLGVQTHSVELRTAGALPNLTARELQGGSRLVNSLSVPEVFIQSLARNCPNLKVIKFSNCVIDGQSIRLSLFPKSVESLSYQGVVFRNRPEVMVTAKSSPFYTVTRHLPNLKELRVCLGMRWWSSWDTQAVLAECRHKISIEREGREEREGQQQIVFKFSPTSQTISREERRETLREILLSIEKYKKNIKRS